MGVFSVKWLVLWSLWAIRLVPLYTPVVRVSNGLLRGVYSIDGSYSAYFSIPYASNSRETRFQAPGSEIKWEGVLDAVDESVRCRQRLHGYMLIGQENCLTLNVYSPKNHQISKLPVMVFLHGGGFYMGSGSRMTYGPDFLVAKEVILVTVNYRLNIQGFLCLGVKKAPGNAGMKDQVAALKWVQRNIKSFGGDPDNITIFGESAGAASVSYHILSPMSKGLFHKAILQSGSSLGAWAYQHDPVFLASLLAKTMLYNTQDPHKLYNIFMNKTDDELILTRVPRKNGNNAISELLYTPCTERKIEGVEPFLTELPINLLKKGEYNKVPVIVGTNIEEGLLFAELENDTTIEQMSFHKMLPKNLHFPTEVERNEVAKKITDMYLPDSRITKENFTKVAKYYGEPFFIVPSLIEAEIYFNSSGLPVFSYWFKYEGRRNMAKWTLKQMAQVPGATHADDLFYLFSQWYLPVDDPIVERMTTLWTNFAKFGDPTPEVNELLPLKWEPLKPAALKSLVIDKEFSFGPLYYNDRLLHLKEIYEKYRRKDNWES